MSAPEKEGLAALEDLAHLADDLAEALAEGDVQGAREAHTAIGRGLETASDQPLGVVDLARERARRTSRRAIQPMASPGRPPALLAGEGVLSSSGEGHSTQECRRTSKEPEMPHDT
jgi:hypothetical protein